MAGAIPARETVRYPAAYAPHREILGTFAPYPPPLAKRLCGVASGRFGIEATRLLEAAVAVLLVELCQILATLFSLLVDGKPWSYYSSSATDRPFDEAACFQM